MNIFFQKFFSQFSTFQKDTYLIVMSFLHLLFSFQRSLWKVVPSKTKQEFVSFFLYFLLRKEVIHPHVPVGIPCYDLTPVIGPTFDGSLP